ncbi:Anthranilate synthase, aminase component [hydrothermal vent metagenome]|uniref:Anthranilate synthase component 1 n=1 Tax=hydrothermal vent metagenome TaxID=652676 RepID=A0A3B1D5M8_9ZZZZ
MTHFPSPDLFAQYAEDVDYVPVYRQLTSDTLTPVSAYCKIQWGECSFLFESVVGGEQIGRFSFLGSDPFFRMDAYGQNVVLNDHSGNEKRFVSEDPLQLLAEKIAEFKVAQVAGLPPFCGGAVGYAGYDVIRYSENLPHPPEDDRKLPDMSFAFYDRMVIFDQINKTILVIAFANLKEDEPTEAYKKACGRVDEMCRQLQRGDADLQLTDISVKGEPRTDCSSNFTQEEFEAAVTASKEYIKAGDVFQVVLSQRLQRETHARPLDIYRALRVVNPSPFMFLLKTPQLHLIGSSPEIMVRVEEGRVTIRPLAGTRRRGKTEEEDKQLAEELLADPKERAEHVMLIDLARNDVGRVAQFGSVELSDVMVVEKYSHVMHITSNVNGQLQEGKTAIDALRAGLPAGTVSGAPKVRAMEIIDELEPHRRGPYGGAVGYIDFTGNMDTCIALRTLVMQGQTISIQAGAGLVADSIPATEYLETLSKAMGMLKAIEIAEEQL